MALSPLSLVVLALLAEEPMHPYRMQQLIKERGVDIVVNVRNRSGLYGAIDRLAREGLIHVHAVERDTRHPERTVYDVTGKGRERLLDGLRDDLAVPADDFPPFPAAVSFLHVLAPQDAQHQLSLRAEVLRQRLDKSDQILGSSAENAVPLVYLLEHDYIRTVTAAELAWVQKTIDGIAAGTLKWRQTLGED